VREQTLWEKTKTFCKRVFGIKGIISSIAAILIIYSIMKQHHLNRWIFWNWMAIVSAAVYIHCGMGIFNDFLFGNRITIFIGKVSYAWYLTHFPLLKYCNFCSRNLYVNVVTGFILAILFTYGIENNIRWNKSKCVVPCLVLAMGLLVMLFKNVY
jgi:peptidoglycan/LPS O-acetylase OafA/YrhL